METKEINISLSLNRRGALLLLSAFFICWHPGFIGSETLNLTTYYPAPYGGYVSILTTGDTKLSRDTGRLAVGNVTPTEKLHVAGNSKISGTVAWGTARGTLSADQGASIELGGSGTPYIDFSLNSSQDYSNRLILGAAGRLDVAVDLQVGRDLFVTRDLRVTRDLYIGGSLRSMCERRAYGVGATVFCSANFSTVGFLGDGTARVSGFLPTSATSTSVGTFIVLGEDWGGTMICCKFF